MTDSSTFDRRFLAFFALLIVVVGMAFVFAVTFAHVPKDNQQYASTALGFILGTLLAAPIGFFYGASKTQPSTPEGTPTDPVSVHETEPTKAIP